MKIIYFVLIFFHKYVHGKLPDLDKIEFCENLQCDENVDNKVCGIRYEEEEVRFKMFDNECKLLQFGCQVDDSKAYGIIDMKHCRKNSTRTSKNIEHVKFINCPQCTSVSVKPVCGIRQDGDGFRIRTFINECELTKYNCYNDFNFSVTDFFICANDPNVEEQEEEDEVFPNEILDEEPDDELYPAVPEDNKKNKAVKAKTLVVVDGTMLDAGNINESISKFFAATHVLDLPMKEMRPYFNESTRKRMLKIFGPIRVFKPWVTIPKNISDDYYHRPTLSSCYHTCPTKCPDTYAPVCGVPGIVAREPSLMFQNHCFMDVAQCKMFWEGKSYTAESSAYIESSFLFCLGDELNGLYRFLPLIRTLQHMGRLRLKGHFRYKLRNMRFFNNRLLQQPKIMG